MDKIEIIVRLGNTKYKVTPNLISALTCKDCDLKEGCRDYAFKSNLCNQISEVFKSNVNFKKIENEENNVQ